MSNVFFDIRGGVLKVLIAEGQNIKYTKVFDQFSLENADACHSLFRQIGNESSENLDVIHLIVPSDEFRIKTYKLQKMPSADTKTVINRRIMQEEGGSEPVFHLMTRDAGPRNQECIAAIIEPKKLRNYSESFAKYGLNVGSITSPFHANLKAYEQKRLETNQTTAVLEIGTDMIEIMVASPSYIISYEALIYSSGEHAETDQTSDIDVLQKKRLYGIVDALYKFILNYRDNFAENPIERVLICGDIDNDTRITGAVEEAFGIDASVWNPIEGVSNGATFTALYGYSLGFSDGTAVNFISSDLSGRKKFVVSRSLVTASFFICLAFLGVLLLVTEMKVKTASERLYSAQKEKQGALKKAVQQPGITDPMKVISKQQPSFYGILRHLANDLPDGISLEEFALKQEAGEDVFDIKFVSTSDLNSDKEKLVSRFMESINNSKVIYMSTEPSMSVSREGEISLTIFQITAKAVQNEKK